MKAIKFIFKEIIYPGSFIFTLYNIFAHLADPLNEDDPERLKTFFLILLCCLAIAVVNKIFRTDMSLPIKIAIHYVGVLLSVIGIFVVMGSDNAIASIFMILTVVYAVVAIPVLIIYKKVTNKKNEEQEYDSQFR